MDCNFTTIKTCELKDSTFRSRILDFGDFDISDYTFSVVYKTGFDQVISEQELTATGNILTVPLEAIEGTSNRAKAEVWMHKPGGFKDCVIVFDVVISATGCPSDASITEGVSVTFGGLKVPVVITQAIVNNYLSWEDLAPEHILELQQPAIDAGNEVRQQVDDYIEAKELQINPVIDAAETATQEANDAAQTANTSAQNADNKATAATTAADNANAATTAAETATTNANEATSTANTATTNANNATTAANTAAGNAQSAANDANDINNAVQLAENTRISNETTRINQESTRQTNETTRVSNEAARVSAESARVTATATAIANAVAATNAANNAKGWSPKFIFMEDGAQRIVKKLDSWIGGTGTAPTDNVGMYVANGGYTSNISLAENFKGAMGDNLIFEQTLNSNKVVTIESIDYATNTFYATSHGLTQSIHALVLNNDVNTLNPSILLPIVTNNSLYLKTDTLTANSFQLTTSSNGLGAAIVLVNQATADVTKFKIEGMNNPGTVTGLSYLNLSDCKIEISGSVLRGGYSHPHVQNAAGFSTVLDNTLIDLKLNTSVSGSFTMTSFSNYKYIRIIDIDVKNSIEMIEEMIGLNLGPTNTSNVINAKRYTYSRTANVPNNIITGFTISTTGAFISNGTTIKIYKK